MVRLAVLKSHMTNMIINKTFKISYVLLRLKDHFNIA